MDWKKNIIVGISGASGAIYGREFVRELLRQDLIVHLIVSRDAYTVWSAELGVGGSPDKYDFQKWLGVDSIDPQRLRHYGPDQIASLPASGTFQNRGMAIVPCSMHTLAAIAAGLADNLMTRAADVCLKEGRPLILAPRETPLNLNHLRNMTRLAEAGAKIVPAMPGFYHRPKSIDDLVELFVMKLCDVFGLPCSFNHRWLEKKKDNS